MNRPASTPLRTGDDYLASLRGRGLRVFARGERIDEPVDHPLTAASARAVAATYDIAAEQPALGAAGDTNRFLHIARSVHDVVAQNELQRALGRRTGTCFQRCVGMDAINALFSVTFDCDAAHGTDYHARFNAWLAPVQAQNLVIGGAMTDPKGDRSKGPTDQADPDLFLRVVRRTPTSVVLRGAKVHQTGCLNSHWLLVMPTMRMGKDDGDYAVVAAVPVEHPGLTYVLGRQASDGRALEGGDIDQGNAGFSGQEAMIVFDDVEVPLAHVFMDGETAWAAPLVERFTAYHRRSYVCKTGLGDVLVGAAAEVAEYHGVERASHVRDKLVEMAHLNETIYGTGVAASHKSFRRPAGNYEPDGLLANVTKHNVTRFPFEIARLAQDLAGGLVGTLPSEQDLAHPDVGPLMRKYLAVRQGVSVENRMRILRLIENLTMGRNAVGYLTESMHGAGSPQAQRIQIARQMGLDAKKALARKLAGVKDGS